MKLIKHEVLYAIKKNPGYYFNLFTSGKIDDVLSKEFTSSFFNQSDFTYNKLDFDMSITDSGKIRRKTDLNNSIEIYSKYQYLTESQASDELFWASLALYEDNLNYIFYRWDKTVKTIKYRITYHASGKRGYMYHGLARPWWFAHLTYDSTHEDPYHLTRFTYEYPHIMEKMIYRNFSNSSKIRKVVIASIKSFIEKGGKYSTSKIDKLYRYVGVLGSNKLLDLYDEKNLSEILVNYLESLEV
ncbi:DUF6339 family protein [Acholeplasma granularum]|uniref:DUF6339 family protein n=1 Tax=Acholeplasma granularum TaxID=264635 RepID=UPI000472BAC0|nr:DUF6339 family protein [Acholeplasma granularum]